MSVLEFACKMKTNNSAGLTSRDEIENKRNAHKSLFTNTRQAANIAHPLQH